MSTPTKRRKHAATLTKVETLTRPAEEKPPVWARETPELTFTLEWYHYNLDSDADNVIRLTRAEFVALKERLAELRGIPFDAERAA